MFYVPETLFQEWDGNGSLNIPRFMFTEKCCGNINMLVFMWIYVKNLWGHYMHSSTGSQKNVCMTNIWIHYPHSGTNTSWKRGPTCGYMVEQRLLIFSPYLPWIRCFYKKCPMKPRLIEFVQCIWMQRKPHSLPFIYSLKVTIWNISKSLNKNLNLLSISNFAIIYSEEMMPKR